LIELSTTTVSCCLVCHTDSSRTFLTSSTTSHSGRNSLFPAHAAHQGPCQAGSPRSGRPAPMSCQVPKYPVNGASHAARIAGTAGRTLRAPGLVEASLSRQRPREHRIRSSLRVLSATQASGESRCRAEDLVARPWIQVLLFPRIENLPVAPAMSSACREPSRAPVSRRPCRAGVSPGGRGRGEK